MIRRIMPELLRLEAEEAFRPEMWDKALAPRMSRRTMGSRPDEGSSSTRSSGRWARAASRPARAFWPLESVLIGAVASRAKACRSSSA